GMLPCYGLTEGLKMHELRRIVRTAVESAADLVPEVLPDELRERHCLPRIGQALRQTHFPANREQYDAGRRRLILQDLLELQLGLALRRRTWRRRGEAARLPLSG